MKLIIAWSTMHMFMVDDCDFKWLNCYKWHASIQKNTTYARTIIEGKYILIHRLIMGDPKGNFVDHKDTNGSNNQRENLRVCTQSQNMQNSVSIRNGLSGFKGVSYNKRKRKWFAQIMVNYRNIFLGYFNVETDAAIAYNNAALHHFGQFARLNVLEVP